MQITRANTPWQNFPGLDQLLVTPSTPGRFIANLLDLLIAIPEIDAVWIGRPNDDGVLLPEAARGLDMKVLRDENAMVNVWLGPRSQGPAGRAWRLSHAQISRDINEDNALAPWRDEWALLGLQVGAAIPLIGVDGVNRILNFYSCNADFFEVNWPIPQLAEFGKMIGSALESRDQLQVLLHSKRLLETLFVSAETLFCADTETALLYGICERLSATGLFICAAIGTVDCDGMFSYQIAAGTDASGVRQLRQSIIEAGAQQLLGVQAWKTGNLQTADGYATLSRLEPWRHIAHRGGWTSAAAAPIRRDGKNFAVLFLVSNELNTVDLETQRLIIQLARDIGRALDEIDLKKALRAERETQSEMARRDKLTDLPNRRAFEEALPVALAHATRHGSVIGIGILDLDNFKPINDHHGHGAGDVVLQTLGRRLRTTLRDVDFIARLGGDEYALIIADMSSLSRLNSFCARLNAAINAPIHLESGIEVVMSASLGFTFFPVDQGPPDILIRHADMALYASKAVKGKRSRYWMTYQESIGVSQAENYNRTLLHQGCLEVHYQPIIAVGNGTVVGIEALARLRDSQLLLQPGEFLSDLSTEDREVLFSMVLRESIFMLTRLATVAENISLSVNIDAEVLARGNVPDIINAVLQDSTITPNRLILELLESHEFLTINTARHLLEDVRKCGVKIAVDDVGVEFSTFKRVRRLPIDHLKIDRVFLTDVMVNPHDLVFLSSYITIAATLGITLCVEGVETADILEALRILGAPLAQGFGICQPLPAADLVAWLTKHVCSTMGSSPRSLLGAYALHTRWLRVFQFIRGKNEFTDYLRRHTELSLENFLRDNGLVHTPLGEAYAALMLLTDATAPDYAAIDELSDRVRILLSEAITSEFSVNNNVKPHGPAPDRFNQSDTN